LGKKTEIEIFETKYLSLTQMSETWVLMFWGAPPEFGMDWL